MGMQVHVITASVTAENTLTIRPANGKIGKFFYAKIVNSNAVTYLYLVPQTGSNIKIHTATASATTQWGFLEETAGLYHPSIIIDYNNYLSIMAPASTTLTVTYYWVEQA